MDIHKLAIMCAQGQCWYIQQWEIPTKDIQLSVERDTDDYCDVQVCTQCRIYYLGNMRKYSLLFRVWVCCTDAIERWVRSRSRFGVWEIYVSVSQACGRCVTPQR